MQAGMALGNLASAIGLRTEDEVLIAALKSGSDEAFSMLIAQYSQPIYSLIARSVQDPADASDITQEVFLKVFRNIRSFHGDSSLRTWIYRIALREASNQRRWWSRHKRQEFTIDEPMENEEGDGVSLAGRLLASGQSPYEQAEQGEIKARVEDALRQLPEMFRVVVVLREIEGFSYDEIAEILNMPAGTVKSRLTRGRSALKEILVKEGVLSDVGRRTVVEVGR